MRMTKRKKAVPVFDLVTQQKRMQLNFIKRTCKGTEFRKGVFGEKKRGIHFRKNAGGLLESSNF